MAGQRSVTRPKSVKIGWQLFSIEWLNDDDWYLQKHDDNWGGATIHEEGRIVIRCQDGRSEDSLRETLLHEMTHAIWSTRGLNHFPRPEDLDELEEYIITSQSGGLLLALNDNPEALAYLLALGNGA